MSGKSFPDRPEYAESNHAHWLLLLLLLAGTLLRLWNLNSGLWYDEIVTVLDSVRKPLASIVTHFPSNNDHLCYSVLARLSTVAFGEHPWSLRLPAFLFGIASLPMLYYFGLQVTSRFESLVATLLLTVSFHHIWFSQNGRGYTIMLFCTLLGTACLLAGLHDDKRRYYVTYAIVAALASYTHLTMVLVAVAQAGVVAVHLLMKRPRPAFPQSWVNPMLGFGLAALLTLVLYAPVLADVQSFFQARHPSANVATPTWALVEAVRGLRTGYTTTGALIGGGLLFLAGSLSYLRQSPIVLGFFYAPGAVLMGITLGLHRPIYPRYFFFLAGFALLLVVRGAWVTGAWLVGRLPASFVPEKYRAALAAVPIACMVAVSLAALPRVYRYPKQDYEQALRYLESTAGPHEVIAIVGSGTEIPFQRFYRRPWPRIRSVENLRSLAREHGAVWVVYTFRAYIAGLEPELLEEVLSKGRLMKTFPGTVPDGAIAVRKYESP